MEELLFYIFVLIVSPIIFFLLIMIIKRNGGRSRPREDEWSELAQRLGLTFNELLSRERMVDGYYRGYAVEVYLTREVRPTTSGDISSINILIPLIAFILPSRATCVVVFFENPLGDVELALRHETRRDKADKILFGEDVRIGDETFDGNFLIRSRPKELAKRVFSSQYIRRRLLEADYPAFSFDGKELKWMKTGIVKDIDQIQFVMDLLCDIADAIWRARPLLSSY